MVGSPENNRLRSELEAIRNAEIKILFCEQFDESSDKWNFTLHNHNAIELMYFRSGKGTVNVDAGDVSISSYDVIVYPAGAFHREFLSPATHQEIICIHLTPIDGFRFDRTVHIRDKNKTFRYLFEEIFRNYHSGEEGTVNLAPDFARLLLMNCARHYTDSYENADFIDQVLEYIDEHFRDSITLTKLVEMVHVSTTYLSKRFKERTGTSIIKYINSLRIEEAKHMLKLTDYPIEVISENVGYDSSKYFARMFKAYTQMTPNEYRHK